MFLTMAARSVSHSACQSSIEVISFGATVVSVAFAVVVVLATAAHPVGEVSTATATVDVVVVSWWRSTK